MLYFVILLSVLLLTELWVLGAARNLVKQECVKLCGNITVESPFGIGMNCFKNKYFEVTCNTSSPIPKPILTKFNLELLYISKIRDDGSMGMISVHSLVPSPKACTSQMTNKINNNTSQQQQNGYEVRWNSVDLRGSPFYLDSDGNWLVSVGCDGYASLYNETAAKLTGCSSTCSPTGLAIDGCNGYHCCEAPFTSDEKIQRYSIGITTDNASLDNSTRCRSAFLVQRGFLKSEFKYNASNMNDQLIPFVLSWDFHSSKGGDYYLLESIAIYIAIGLGGLALSFGCFCSCWLHNTRKRRKEARLRTKYFKRRFEQTLCNEEVVEKAKLYSAKEIKKATNNFNEDRILGRGGQGVVYKGMLDDGVIIAVKQSKTIEESQWQEFINELILLSQVNHRNIVKILGCCLETKVPILIYEFISNGTLSQHIHGSTSESLITWELRLRIAAEASGAIAYLHSSSTTPIYHRDIKSTNILLDDMHQAKVSDFGISKALFIDQTHLTTNVKGTFGYLDPEYFRSSQYSEKSDVYSFGVILIELLTGQQAIRIVTNEEERSLVEYFNSSMNRNALEEILDPIVLLDSKKEDVMEVANLTKWCLHSRGALRPTMKEVALKLELIRNKSNSMAIIPSEVQRTDSALASPILEIDRVNNNPANCGITNDLSESCAEEKCLISTI